MVWFNSAGKVEDVEVFDAKGMRTQSYKRAKRQVESLYPIKISEV